jgi:hypothetical protein
MEGEDIQTGDGKKVVKARIVKIKGEKNKYRVYINGKAYPFQSDESEERLRKNLFHVVNTLIKTIADKRKARRRANYKNKKEEAKTPVVSGSNINSDLINNQLRVQVSELNKQLIKLKPDIVEKKGDMAMVRFDGSDKIIEMRMSDVMKVKKEINEMIEEKVDTEKKLEDVKKKYEEMKDAIMRSSEEVEAANKRAEEANKRANDEINKEKDKAKKEKNKIKRDTREHIKNKIEDDSIEKATKEDIALAGADLPKEKDNKGNDYQFEINGSKGIFEDGKIKRYGTAHTFNKEDVIEYLKESGKWEHIKRNLLKEKKYIDKVNEEYEKAISKLEPLEPEEDDPNKDAPEEEPIKEEEPPKQKEPMINPNETVYEEQDGDGKQIMNKLCDCIDEHQNGKGLYTNEIDAVMKDLPSYKGTPAYDKIKELSSNDNRIAFIYNTDTSKGDGKHWVAVLITHEPPTIEHYDSLADSAPKNFIEQIQHLLKPAAYQFKENFVKSQSNTTDTCGFHCMKFILDRLINNKTWKQASNFQIIEDSIQGEKDIDKFKKILEKNKYKNIRIPNTV